LGSCLVVPGDSCVSSGLTSWRFSTPISMLEPNRLYLPWMRRPQGPRLARPVQAHSSLIFLSLDFPGPLLIRRASLEAQIAPCPCQNQNFGSLECLATLRPANDNGSVLCGEAHDTSATSWVRRSPPFGEHLTLQVRFSPHATPPNYYPLLVRDCCSYQLSTHFWMQLQWTSI
jgi:hypothetical protein